MTRLGAGSFDACRCDDRLQGHHAALGMLDLNETACGWWDALGREHESGGAPQLFIQRQAPESRVVEASCGVTAKSTRASFSTQFHITTTCCSYGGYATPSVSHMLLCTPNSFSTYLCTTLSMPPYIIFEICNTSPTSNYTRSSSRTPNTCSIRSGGQGSEKAKAS
jgi:hypothetical protein